MTTFKVIIPADVPRQYMKQFLKNYDTLTYGTGDLMLFAGDQKIEHLNDDFPTTPDYVKNQEQHHALAGN